MSIAYLNGKYIQFKNARLPVMDLGVSRGYGVSDTVVTNRGAPFLLAKHLERFQQSAKNLYLKLPLSQKQLRSVAYELLKSNHHPEAVIRFLLTGGPAYGKNKHKPTLCVYTEELYYFAPSCYTQGVHLIAEEVRRDFPQAKTINYAVSFVAMRKNAPKKPFEILYVSQEKVLETSTSNFFIFKHNTLVTACRGILKGITREVVLRFARKRFKIEERDMRVSELKQATESFITASIKSVMPVTKIDGRAVYNGKVGENTKWVMDEYKKIILA